MVLSSLHVYDIQTLVSCMKQCLGRVQAVSIPPMGAADLTLKMKEVSQVISLCGARGWNRPDAQIIPSLSEPRECRRLC